MVSLSTGELTPTSLNLAVPEVVEIRDVRLEDADALGAIHVLAWQKAYRGLMPDEYLDGLSIDERRAMWKDHLRDGTGDSRVLVAAQRGQVRGFATVGPDRGDEKDAGELYAINLHPDHWRHGIGRKLLDASVDALREGGYRRAVLWVHVGNDRARRFYEALGWRCDGEAKYGNVLGADTHEVRYRIDLEEGWP